MTLVVFTSSSEMVWTSERFARSAEGKAVGFERVTTVLEEVSVTSQGRCWRLGTQDIPLHEAPHMVQVKMAFCLPALPSSRLPQSVQKTREPMADILRFSDRIGTRVLRSSAVGAVVAFSCVVTGRRLGKKEPGFISRGASARWAELGKRSNATNPSAPEPCQSHSGACAGAV